jgi:hypothetical protein
MKVKKYLSFALALAIGLIAPLASAEVVVINSLGEGDLPIPIFIVGDESVSSENAGAPSTNSVQMDGGGEIFNDEYEGDGGTPYDVSAAAGYINFYVQQVSGTMDYVEICMSLGEWGSGACWFDLQDNWVVGEWTYVSVDITAADYFLG